MSLSLHRCIAPLALALLCGQAAHAERPLLEAHDSGEKVYNTVCMACHESGVAHAPKVGDRTAWAPLIEEGQHVLTGHAWVGVRAMPAREGNADLSLTDFARAVAFMARASGADWQGPDRKLLLKIVKEADKRLVQSIREQQSMQRELHQIAKKAK